MTAQRWSNPPRLPLVDPWYGVCEAENGPWTPGEETLKECCNAGYARGRCARFPAAAPHDAVRFTAGAGGEILYVLEKDYSPAGHGTVAGSDGRLAAQAAAFAQSWARRPRKERNP
jgi:hypothetical protein